MREQNNTKLTESIACVLYGQALGDAYGMPSELLPYKKLQELFGTIRTLLPGHPENPASHLFVRAQITDDTEMAFCLIKAILKQGGAPDAESFAHELLKWADTNEVWDKNILGPSSSAALKAFRDGMPVEEIDAPGLTNGCIMRISPMGCILPVPDPNDKTALEQYFERIYAVNSPTHKSELALAASVFVTSFISAGIDGASPKTAFQTALRLARYAQEQTSTVFTPSVAARLSFIFPLLDLLDDEEAFTKHFSEFPADKLSRAALIVRELIGTTMAIQETLPAVVFAAFVTDFHPRGCAQFCANLGGDTDTIGAIATALCGAFSSIDKFDHEELELLEHTNKLHVKETAVKLASIRKLYEQEK
ncbi:MAG: ADP-ribosylglycohydrolase family protein [Coriobacteriia bacterium]|nr:ADP-ribosylglycohydrolase family protein [Coriobacteriia bacterium]